MGPFLSSSQMILHGPTRAEWERAHEAMKADPMLWSCLALDGIQSDGLGGLIESRRCPCPGCGSSLSQRTTPQAAVEALSVLAGVQARSLEAIAHAAAAVQRPSNTLEPDGDSCLARP
jgi:hypothetical protein